MKAELTDIRHAIFESCNNQTFVAVLTAETTGIISGVERAKELAAGLDLEFSAKVADGQSVTDGTTIASLSGAAMQIARAEEILIGALSKASGIATRARQALEFAGTDLTVVCGGWKKMPHEIKGYIREAVRDGGLVSRMADQPFVYLDKNYVRMLGGIEQAIRAVAWLTDTVVVQIRGETAPIEEEAVQAARLGVSVVMIDTGNREHVAIVDDALRRVGLRDRVRLAFAGRVCLDDLQGMVQCAVDIVDIGYDILDAPALPIRFDVVRMS